MTAPPRVHFYGGINLICPGAYIRSGCGDSVTIRCIQPQCDSRKFTGSCDCAQGVWGKVNRTRSMINNLGR